ncbi:hypothetical protein EXIGLDRAFT_700473 [Exidia glandulosa HHB12029]|uniref:Uncharacterized protein n=1 Tax=Exidia glandulosa HHB12029 TaxID=1314781 RepID=A0A165ZNK4_EXIGL|nr:hypothetical protein EXIGLDRAFT_700473 [Exidia glandulosa HHB12029]
MSFIDYEEMLAQMLAADHAPTNVVSRAQAYATELASANAPTTCALCLLDFATVVAPLVHTDRATLQRTLEQCPHFWDACVRTLTAPRTESELTTVRGQLKTAISSCNDMHRHPIDEIDVEDLVHVLIDAASIIVSAGLRFSVHPPSACAPAPFTRTVWPTASAQLLPFGGKQSLEQLVSWCESAGAAPLLVLGSIFTLDPDRVFNILLDIDNDALRARLLDVVLRALLGDMEESTLPTDPRVAAKAFLGPFLYDGDTPEKLERFVAGRKAEFMHAYNST